MNEVSFNLVKGDFKMARPKAPEKKELIRKAAINLISEEGFYNVTTDKIAEKAGVSVGTIYNYFKNKEDIISYIFQVEQKKLKLIFNRVKKKKLSVPEKFKILIDKYFKYVFYNKKLARLIHIETHRPSVEITREIFDFIYEIRQHLKELIREGVEENSLYAEYNPDMIVNIIMGLSYTTVFFAYENPEQIEYLYKKGPEDIYQMLSKGIIKKETNEQECDY